MSHNNWRKTWVETLYIFIHIIGTIYRLTRLKSLPKSKDKLDKNVLIFRKQQKKHATWAMKNNLGNAALFFSFTKSSFWFLRCKIPGIICFELSFLSCPLMLNNQISNLGARAITCLFRMKLTMFLNSNVVIIPICHEEVIIRNRFTILGLCLVL